MTAVSVFSSAGLPAVSTLTTALRGIKATAGDGGTAILKMDKTGTWVFGADQTEVQEGSKWAINPFSFIHGYIAWGDGEVLGEVMVPIQHPLPEVDTPPPNAKKGWETQLGMSLRCLSGEDAGAEVRFSTTSVGGKKAAQELALALAEQVDKDQSKPVPVVTFEKDHYQHKSYGRIYTPIFKVVEWMSMDGAPAAVAIPTEEAPAPAGRRRRAPVVVA